MTGSNAVITKGFEPATSKGLKRQTTGDTSPTAVSTVRAQDLNLRQAQDQTAITLGAARGLAAVMQARRPDLKWSVLPVERS
jgi:hypothetical protein